MSLGLESVASGLAVSTTVPNEIELWNMYGLMFLSLTPASLLLFSLTYARGEGKISSTLWFLTLFFSLSVPLGSVILFPEKLVVLVNPNEGMPWSVVFGGSGVTIQYTIFFFAALVLVNLERTYRASVGTMRWRIKFMIIGLAVLMFIRIYTSSQVILLNISHPSLNILNSVGLLVTCLLVLRTMLRSGHFDIEVYPSQAVLKNSLTIFVVGTYLIAVGLFAKLVTLFGGESAFAFKALGILVTLVLLGLLIQSDRFRLHLRQFISRHFKRPLYDYQAVWKRFTEETASHTNQQTLCRSLATLISEVFDALSVSIWLTDENCSSELKLLASTSLLRPQGSTFRFPEDVDLNQVFKVNSGPIDLEPKDSTWASAIKDSNPKKISRGGNRICIPMTARDSCIGIIVLGDRVGGEQFLVQEFDILASVGNHAAACLQNILLSNKLLESKEFEAFQTMATFFVHDLKNTASTLNIMVKNLPIHWDNPEFRADALRGISKTGSRINQLIGRLSTVQDGLEVHTKTVEVDALAQSVIDNWEAPEGIQLVPKFESKQTAEIDFDQISKVLLNLILNAQESMDPNGSIDFQTEATQTHAVFVVRDKGVGMSPEYIRNSLFRPFRSTKRSGLGIGMFQSKLIVEAHSGKIEVESKVGNGTVFKVHIPISSKIQKYSNS